MTFSVADLKGLLVDYHFADAEAWAFGDDGQLNPADFHRMLLSWVGVAGKGFVLTYDMGNGWGVNGHVGHLSAHNFSELGYTDYKLGVTKDLSGWVLGAALVSTNAKHNCSNTPADPYCFVKVTGGTYDGGKSTVVLSVSKTF